MRLSEIQIEQQRWQNAFHTAVIFFLLALLFFLLGSWFFGPLGALILAAIGLISLSVSISRAPRLILSFYGARQLYPEEATALYNVTTLLSNWADLEHRPTLYYIPSSMQNAFAVGSGKHAAIAVSDGLIRKFPMWELAAILAHEVSHIKNKDTYVLGVADVFGRFTSFLSTIGLVLLLLALPLYLVDAQPFPFIWLVLLNLLPLLSNLLLLALSRAREFQADLQAAVLTGDPRGLISALKRLEQQNYGFFERWFPSQRNRRPEPSLLRTHPPTEERIQRLQAIQEEQTVPILHLTEAPFIPYFPLQYQVKKPRWHLGGCWW